MSNKINSITPSKRIRYEDMPRLATKLQDYKHHLYQFGYRINDLLQKRQVLGRDCGVLCAFRLELDLLCQLHYTLYRSLVGMGDGSDGYSLANNPFYKELMVEAENQIIVLKNVALDPHIKCSCVVCLTELVLNGMNKHFTSNPIQFIDFVHFFNTLPTTEAIVVDLT
jgi:hypothetical protein